MQHAYRTPYQLQALSFSRHKEAPGFQARRSSWEGVMRSNQPAGLLIVPEMGLLSWMAFSGKPSPKMARPDIAGRAIG
jgi:hypothetical protein